MLKDYFGYKVSKDGVIFGKRGKAIYQMKTDKGYMLVRLTLEGRVTSKHAHRVVAEAYLQKPEGCVEVDHINCNRSDNRVENLRWVTKEQNVQHSYDCGNRDVLGSKNANCKTSEEIVHKICKLLQQGLKPSKLRDLGFDYGLVRQIKCKKTWKHISDTYFT